MQSGTVSWFKPDKGYGFIKPEGGGVEIFIHIREVEKAGIATLEQGEKLHFDVVPSKRHAGKWAAANIRKAA